MKNKKSATQIKELAQEEKNQACPAAGMSTNSGSRQGRL
jgi:hypothetical protein